MRQVSARVDLRGSTLEPSDNGLWSSDQAKGLGLALSSSVFIGSSFIIKKKGLRQAGVTGLRAGIKIAAIFCAQNCCHFPVLPLIVLVPITSTAVLQDKSNLVHKQGCIGLHC